MHMQQASWKNAGPEDDGASPRKVLSNVTKAGANEIFAGGLRS